VLHLRIRLLGELRELEQVVRTLRALVAAQTEVAAVDQQVLADGQLIVEGVLLRHDAEAGTDRRAVAVGVLAEDP
jgi:hypothetical protein